MNKYPFVAIVVIMLLVPCRAESQSGEEYSGLRRLHFHNPSLTTGFHITARRGISKKSMAITDATPGYHVTARRGITIDHFSALLPSSEILQRDHHGLELEDQFFLFSGFNPWVVSASVGVMISDKSGEEILRFPRMRFGISYYGGNMLVGRFMRENVTRVDSFLLSGTGQVLYVDSVHQTFMMVQQSSEHLCLDLALEFSSSTSRRLSVNAGVGVSGGLPVISYAAINYSDNHLRRTSTPGGKVVSTTTEISVSENETLAEGSYWVLMPYIPFGVDLRLGSRDSFFGQLSLRYEGRAGLRMVMAGDGNTLVNLRRHHSLGLAFRW